jgi:hypothetical protein
MPKLKPILPFFYDYVFPNTILPNALSFEMGVVNYINTKYTNRLQQESFFDEGLESPQSPFKLLFGNNMGEMPQSLRWGGSHLRMPCFQDRVEIYEDSVYFGKRNMPLKGYNKYIYTIKVTLHFSRFTGTDRVGSKLNGEFFWKHISEDVLDDARNNRAVIFLDWANENFIDQTDYMNLHNAIKYSGIPRDSIILAVNSFNAQQIYEGWFQPHERCLQVRNLPFLINQISYHYSHNPDIMISEKRFVESKNTHRNNYFMYTSRRARDHRLAMIFKFASDGVLDKADWSCLDPVPFEQAFSMASSFDLGYNVEACRQYFSMVPKSLQSEQGSSFNSVAGWNDQHSESNINSYFYVAAETYVHAPYKSMTEKLFKPIANYNPFLVVSFAGALEELRNLGFRTFEGFIDESYDKEIDSTRRMAMVAAEVKRLCSMSKEEIHNWYWSMEDILIHNRNRLMSLYLLDNHSQSFIEYLHYRVRSPV